MTSSSRNGCDHRDIALTNSVIILSEEVLSKDAADIENYYNLSCSSSGFSSLNGSSSVVSSGSNVRPWLGGRRNSRVRSSQVVVRTRHLQEPEVKVIPESPKVTLKNCDNSTLLACDGSPPLHDSGFDSKSNIDHDEEEEESGLNKVPSSCNTSSYYSTNSSTVNSSTASTRTKRGCLIKIVDEDTSTFSSFDPSRIADDPLRPASNPPPAYECQDVSLWLEEDEGPEDDGVVVWRCTGGKKAGDQKSGDQFEDGARRRRRRRRRKRRPGTGRVYKNRSMALQFFHYL